MKSLVVGAMLLRTMNAQIAAVPAADTSPAVSANALPGISAVAPAIPLGSTSSPAIPLGSTSVPAVPLGSTSVPAVPLGSTSVPAPLGGTLAPAVPLGSTSVPAVPLGGTSAPAVLLGSTSAPVIAPTLGGAGIIGTALENSASSSVGLLPTSSSAPAADISAFTFPAAPVVSAPTDTALVGASPIAAPFDTSPIAAPIDASPIAAPLDVSPIAAPVDATPVNAVPIDAPVDVSSSGIVDASPVQTTSPAAVTPTPLPLGAALPIGSNPYVGPYDPNSIYDPNSPYYDPYAAPPGWEGNDNGIYDGEYSDPYQGNPPVYDDEDEECPAWCIPENDDYSSYPTSTPDSEYAPYNPSPTPPAYSPVADPYAADPYLTPSYQADPYAADPTTYADYSQQDSNYPPAEPQYYPEPEGNSYPQLKKVRSILRAVRRQVFSWPQASYSDDNDSGYYDGEDGSIPDWLYDISGAPTRPTPAPKPTCPKSCYKPKTTDYGYGTDTARPTYTKTREGGYQTTDDSYYPGPTTDDSYYPGPTSDADYYPDETTDAPYSDNTSKAWYPQDNTTAPLWPTGFSVVPDVPTSIPDEATSVPNEATQAPYEPTTLVTQYQSQPYPEQTGGASSNPGSPAGDYTGDTLDTLCPNTCNPFNPAENFCDVTTGCATTGGSKYYCACRAGFRADNYNAKDFSKQFKIAGQPYVYLAVSTSCNTPCSDQTCSEVLERSQCK